MKEVSGALQPIYQTNKWLDLLFKSDLTPTHKLAGVVIARTCTYYKQKQLQLSDISYYSISRIVKLPSEDVKKVVDDLIELGWLFDTGVQNGARHVYALTFSLQPRGKLKT